MSANTKIEWADHTFNPWEGCTKVSPGCAHCYAEARNARFGGGTAPNWGQGAPRRRTSAHNWNEPRRWNRLQETSGAVHHGAARPRVFCASLADWLDDEVPIAWLADLLTLICETPHLDWLLLTKRPENWAARLDAVCRHLACDGSWRETAPARAYHDLITPWRAGVPPANVWVGATVEDQPRTERVAQVMEIPAVLRFLSCEPLLGPVNVSTWLHHRGVDGLQGIDWVIAGGESGRGARPMHPDWARALRDQCAAAAVPFFFKQWGEWLPRSQVLLACNKAAAIEIVRKSHADSAVMRRDTGIDPSLGVASTSNDADSSIYRVGKHAAGRLLDGAEHNAFPA